MYRFILLLSLFPLFALAQQDSIVLDTKGNDSLALDTPDIEMYWSDYAIYNGDTIPLSSLQEVVVIERPTFANNEDRRTYFRVRRKVFKVYPYALVASQKLTEVEEASQDITKKRKKRKYTKEVERYLREEFEAELRKLTRSEGKILIKLIYRQTGFTTWDLISDYRGGISAFIYQTTAKLYDADLKATYDPFTVDEDAMIEMILQRAFSLGELENQKTPINFSSYRTNTNVMGEDGDDSTDE